jgi:hypothetical protein
MNIPSFGSSPTAGAVCPVHPEQPSVGTCVRCGRFLCSGCRSVHAPPTCPECAARNRDVLGLGGQGLTVGGTLSIAFKLMRATTPVLAVVVAIGSAIGIALELGLPDLPRSAGNLIDRVYDLTVGLVLNVSVVAAMMNASEGRAMGAGEALQEGLSGWSRVLKYRFLSGLLILAFTLLLIVPGVLKALSLAFVTILAWKNVPDPLAESTALTAGRRGPLLGVLTVAFLLFVVTFAVPSVTVAVIAESVPALYVPATVVTNVSVNVAERLLDGSVVAAYLLLCNEVAVGRP